MKNLTIPGGHTDWTELDYLEIIISRDGKTVWINDEEKCLFRAQKINKVNIRDVRKRGWLFKIWLRITYWW